MRALRRCRGARGTQARVRNAYGPPAARGARAGGRKVQFYRPAGAIFTRARRAVQYERDEIEISQRDDERDEIDELLGLRVLLLKMDAPAAAVAVCLHCKTTTESFTHSSRQSSRVPSERLGSQVREVRGIAREVWNSPTLSWTSPRVLPSSRE